MLDKILEHLHKKELKFIWDSNFNMFDKLTPPQALDLHNQLTKIKKLINTDPSNIITIVCKILNIIIVKKNYY